MCLYQTSSVTSGEHGAPFHFKERNNSTQQNPLASIRLEKVTKQSELVCESLISQLVIIYSKEKHLVCVY